MLLHRKKIRKWKKLYFFENYQILQNEKYKNILIQQYKKNLKTIKYQNLSFKSRFVMKSNIGTRAYMTMKYENLLGKSFDEIIEFVLGSKYCYQINDQNISLIMSKSILKDSPIWIAKGKDFPILITEDYLRSKILVKKMIQPKYQSIHFGIISKNCNGHIVINVKNILVPIPNITIDYMP